ARAAREAAWHRLVLGVAALMVAWTVSFDALLHPAIAQDRSLKTFGARVAHLVPADATPYALFPPDPGLRFYAPRPLHPWPAGGASPLVAEVDAEVPPPPPSRLARGFAVLVARRRLVLAIWAVLLAPSIWFTAQVRQDNSIDRLIVPEDPDYVATRSFQQVFGAGEFALLLAEADDPLSPAVVARFDRIERRLAGVPHVQANSALSVFRRAHAGFD